MIHQQIKELFFSSVEHIVSDISQYAVHPDSDFKRSKKIPAQKLISFLVSQGSSSTRVEMLDFWGLDSSIPTASALSQQRAKLKPDALEAVFRHFNSTSMELPPASFMDSHYRFLAADGSTCTFSALRLSHHQTTTVDRHDVLDGIKNVYIGDRGYCSYNNMAHVVEQGQYFLFRTKDIHSKGLVGNFNFPDAESFDIDVSVILVRSHSKKVLADIHTEGYIRFVDQAAAFDYIEYGSYDTYELSFRILRFPISTSTYECIVTNLPRDEFPVERIKTLYNARWSIESSFRKLKYTIGLSNFHAYKPEYVKQEIWARLLAYNITETMINYTLLEKHRTKHEYKVNFTMAAHICRAFLRLTTEKDHYDVMSLLKKELIPIRNERQYPRLQTAHFRRPRYFIYRAA